MDNFQVGDVYNRRRMKQDIGKKFIWDDKQVEIINVFTCYEGDFYEYMINGENTVHRINIHKGWSFVNAIPN